MIRVFVDYAEIGAPFKEEDGRWQIYVFCRSLAMVGPEQYRDPQEAQNDPEITEKLQWGLAFLLDYHEHGNCVWSVHGTMGADRFDTTVCAGIIVWEEPEENLGAKTYDERLEDAAGELAEYTMWCNGEVYRYKIDRITGSVDSPVTRRVSESDVFIGLDGLIDDLSHTLGQLRLRINERIKFVGPAAYLVSDLRNIVKRQ